MGASPRRVLPGETVQDRRTLRHAQRAVFTQTAYSRHYARPCVGTWHDPDVGRPIAAPLEQYAELLGVDLATVRELAAKVEPYVQADGTRIWGLMQLERQLRPEVYGRRRGGYVDRRRPPATGA
jgi:hypothetical protein